MSGTCLLATEFDFFFHDQLGTSVPYLFGELTDTNRGGAYRRMIEGLPTFSGVSIDRLPRQTFQPNDYVLNTSKPEICRKSRNQAVVVLKSLKCPALKKLLDCPKTQHRTLQSFMPILQIDKVRNSCALSGELCTQVEGPPYKPMQWLLCQSGILAMVRICRRNLSRQENDGYGRGGHSRPPSQRSRPLPNALFVFSAGTEFLPQEHKNSQSCDREDSDDNSCDPAHPVAHIIVDFHGLLLQADLVDTLDQSALSLQGGGA